jgi:hypothetical protein
VVNRNGSKGLAMALSLNDALSHYHSVSDTAHKFWGYFQIVAAGTAAFAWSREAGGELQLFAFLALGFAVFAALNWRLVVCTQSEAVAAAHCVKAHASALGDAVPRELRPLVERIDPDPAFLVGVWHAVLSCATLGAVWWRYATVADC